MRLLQEPPAGERSRAAVVVRDDVELVVSFTGADPCYAPSYRADVVETPVAVRLTVSEVDGHVGARTMAGFSRWAQARLVEPLKERAVVDQDGRRYAVAAKASLLALPEPWTLQGYEYSAPFAARTASWQSNFHSNGVGVVLRQGGPDMLEVDWAGDSFRPLLLARPVARGEVGVLYTFAGEEGLNHILAWPEGDGAAWLQVMGAMAPDEVLALGLVAGHG